MNGERSSLLVSIENEDLSGVIYALENGEDIEKRDVNGQTALILAAEKGSFRIVRELLYRDADVNAKDEDGWTALIAACKEGFPDVVVTLLDNGARHNVADMGGWTPLVWSSYKGHSQVVRELLQYGAEPNERGQHNMTALIWAAGRGHTAVVRELLDGGARAEIADKYGTTALIWACRKGHLEAVKLLLSRGSNVNSVGTHGWTPLIMAAKGGYVDVVEHLLRKNCNVNLVDQDGRSALTWAAKGGHERTVRALLNHGVYLNMPDRHGDTPLILAAKEGHSGVINALLSKYADLELGDTDGKTALYQAVEKGHVDCVKELLAVGANTEVSNKEGDTPLIRGARKKHTLCVGLLLENGADLTATDKKGDTALHISVRNKYAGLCEVLLRDQSNLRLLYKPNKAGETPYSIDRASKQSVLSPIFGKRELTADIHRMELPDGQEKSAMALADFIADPSLSTPLTVGLYSRWGAGKSLILNRIQDQLKAYAVQEAVILFRITTGVMWTAISITVTLGLIAWAIGTWVEGLLTALATFVVTVGLLILGRSAAKGHGGNINRCGLKLLEIFERATILFKMMFCVPPSIESSRIMLPVHFIFVDLSRSSIFGDSPLTSLVNLSHELNDAIERDYGIFVPRLFRVFRSGPYRARNLSHVNLRARWKRSCCCIPSVLIAIFITIAAWTALFCVATFGKNPGKIVLGIEIGSACIVGTALLCNIPRLLVIIYCLVLSMKKRIMIVSSQPGIRDETFMHVLKQEIDLQADMLESLDGFTKRQTRVVLFIDLLDSLEQQKVLHFVNSVNALMSEAGHPFVSLISVDQRLLLKAIDQNLANLQDSHIMPYDYFKNVVDLPCYFDEPTKPISTNILPDEVLTALSDIGVADDREPRANRDLEWEEHAMVRNDDDDDDDESVRADCNGRVPLIECHASPAKHLSHESLNYSEGHGETHAIALYDDDRDNVAADLSKFLHDTNSGSLADVKRIMNIVSLTGRILHSRNIPFRWRTLASWISIADAWPYKVTWLVIMADDSSIDLPANIQLRRLYNVTGSFLSMLGDPDMTLDADMVYFETYLSSHHPLLTVGDIRTFLPCTFHIDPCIRKSMTEYLQAMKNGTVSKLQLTGSVTETTQHISSPSSSRFMWKSIADDAVLSQLTSDDIVKQIIEIDGMNKENIGRYQMQLKDHNINGKVLVACDLNELKDALQMAFGDWQLFKTWIVNARTHEQSISSRMAMTGLSYQSQSQADSTVEGSKTDSTSEIPNSPGTSRGIRGISSGSEHASATLHEFDDPLQSFAVRSSSKGPYGSHMARQGVACVSNAQIKQQKQESIDSGKSIKSVKDLSPNVGRMECTDFNPSSNLNNNRHGNHLQRSADSGFASTEVDPNQVRSKPLLRQTSVQEGKEYDVETGAVYNKANNKTEFTHQGSYESYLKRGRKGVRDDGLLKDRIPEIKVQETQSNNASFDFNEFDQIEEDTRKLLEREKDVNERLRSSGEKINRKQIEMNLRSNDYDDRADEIDGDEASNELVHSIKMDLSSASTWYDQVQSASGIPTASHHVKMRSKQTPKVTLPPNTNQRISVDSLSEIPLPPLSMLTGKASPSSSPPLPAPPPEMLTDSEDVISPPAAYRENFNEPLILQTDEAVQEMSFDLTTSNSSTSGMQTIKQSPVESETVKKPKNQSRTRKPQIGAISRIPAISTINSPVRQGAVQTTGYSSPKQRVKGHKANVSPIPPDYSTLNKNPMKSPRIYDNQDQKSFRNIGDKEGKS